MVLQTINYIDLQCFIYSKGSWKIIERVHNVRSTCAKKRASMDEGQGTPVKKGRPRGMSLLTHHCQKETTMLLQLRGIEGDG